MKLLLQAEWLRFWRNRVNLVILALTLLLLCASAIWSGLTAAQHRTNVQARTAQWDKALAELRRTAPATTLSGAAGESTAAARNAFEFGRGEAPPALRPALGGLVLSVRQFTMLPHDIRVSVDSRHLDARRSDVLTNPLLDSIGMPDFAVVVALLLPLSIIGLSYGLVQEAREQGVWRAVCAQSEAPWRVLWAGLLLRLLAVLGLALLASLLAFALDPGASAALFGLWMLAVAAYCLIWIALAGVFNLLRVSAAACALGLLAVWLLTSFAVPAGLYRLAQAQEPAPSRLQAVIDIRGIQHQAEVHMEELLENWYSLNPEHRPQSIDTHAWPVSFIPRFLEQDGEMVPLMTGFDHARSRRMEAIEPATWLSPGLALVLAGDRLAGADAAHHARYVEEVDRFEERWRDLLVPAVMSYRGLTGTDVDLLPEFDPEQLRHASGVAGLLACLGSAAGLLVALLFLARVRIALP